MEDDVKQASTDRYALSQAYRWKAERDKAMQELRQLKREVEGRLMPEGMEWPRFEDGEPVRIGDVVSDVEVRSVVLREDGIILSDCTSVPGWGTWRSYKEPIKRPAPKVLDADGVEIEVGDDLYSVEGMLEFHVSAIDKKSGRIATEAMFALGKWSDPKMYTHRAPVLAADGKPLLDGDEVWRVKDGSGPYHVQEIRDGASVCVGETHREYRPDELTHERPVLDADGNRIEPAMDVWWVCEGDERGVHAEKLHVESIGEDGLVTCDPFNGGTWVELEPSELYVNRPVLDADGVPIHEGDTVWNEVGLSFKVTATNPKNHSFEAIRDLDGSKCHLNARAFTHERPESWELIEADAMMDAKWYCESRGISPEYPKHNGKAKCEDIVRRCKALAERERSE